MVNRLIFIFCLFIIQPLFAQQSPNNAVSLSLGGASATYLNAFSIENNVGAMAFSPSEIAINGANYFGLSDYSAVRVAAVSSKEKASVGISYHALPLAALTMHKAQLAFAKKLTDQVSAGVALNYHSFVSKDAYYQNGTAFTFNIGICYKVNEELEMGFQAFNPNQSVLSSQQKESITSTYRLGVKYVLSSNIDTYIDAFQRSDEDLDLNAGLELTANHLKVRGGFGLNQLVAMGIGWEHNQFTLDACGAYHNQLGFSPSINLRYAL